MKIDITLNGMLHKWRVEKVFGSSLIIAGILLMTWFLINGDLGTGMTIALLPFLSIGLYLVMSNPYWGLMLLFVVNYFLMGIYRYVTVGQLGLLMDFLLLLTLFSALTRSVFIRDLHWKKAMNAGVLLLMIWLLYGILELANPTAVLEAWIYTIRSIIYPFIIALLTSLLFYRYKDFKVIVFLWSFFTILAVMKMQGQVSLGFDPYESRWVNQEGISRLILLSTGTRYFSFFSDPGNFGANMGCAMVVFTICAIYVKKIWLKIYYAGVGLLGMYGMFVSGTRGAIAAPFAGFLLFTILTKKLKAFLVCCLFVFCAYFFLAHTSIGQGNEHIRRMRTAFDPNEPSLVVRKNNQKILANYLKYKPFGEGIGLAGAESQRFAHRITTTIPSDSGFVKIWCQTGIVGLVFYLTIYLSIIAYGVHMVLFHIRDQELRGYLSAVICGLTGILACTYGNSIMGQYPTVILMAMTVAFIYLGGEYDKEIQENNNNPLRNGTNQLV